MSVLAVSSIGVLALMAVLGLGARVLAERRAVEDSIAEMRAYWAAMGASTYVLSRVRFDSTNGQPAEAFAKTAIQEVADGTAGKDMLITWRYPDVSSTYVIVVDPDDPKNDGGPAAPGQVRLAYNFQKGSTSAPEALRTLLPPNPPAGTLPVLRTVEFRYCMVTAAVPACGNADPKGNNYTLQRIMSVHRLVTAVH